MNVSDTEIARSILLNHGFCLTTNVQHVSAASVTVVVKVICIVMD